jgi:asparagine synthetase B (glutamine-hydrolysing)
VLSGEGASREVLARMQRVAQRRGPEHTRTTAVGNCLLAHAALRFVDVGFNEQPYLLGGCALVWNGEIYNRSDLMPFARNDSEVLLSGLREQGVRFLSRIDGQFAFVAVLGSQLWIGRDKWGICPLAFGSTPEGWLAIGSTTEVVEAARCKLVKTLPAGMFGSFRDGRLELGCWYRAPRALVAAENTIAPEEVRAFAEQRIVSRIPAEPRDLFTTMGGMDSQFVSACVARHTRGVFGGAVTVVPRFVDRPAGDYPYVKLTLQRLAAEGIAVRHHIAVLTPEFAVRNVDRLLKLLGPDLFQLLCALGEDLVAATVAEHGGRAIMTAGGPDEAGRSYDRWTLLHRGLDEELAWHRLAEQFSSSEGVRAGLVFGERGIENRVPLADLIELATEIPRDEKQRVDCSSDGTLAGLRMETKIFWRRALRGVLPDACLDARKEPIHESIAAMPVLAEIAREDREYQRQRIEFARHAFWLGWNGIVFEDLRSLDPSDDLTECQLYSLYRWSRVEPDRFASGGEQRYGPYTDYVPRCADLPEERADKPLCYDWQLGRDVSIRAIH